MYMKSSPNQEENNRLFKTILSELRSEENQFLQAGKSSEEAYNAAIASCKGRFPQEEVLKVDQWLKKKGIGGNPTIAGKQPYAPTGTSGNYTPRTVGTTNKEDFLEKAWMKFFLKMLEQKYADSAMAVQFIQSFPEQWQKENARKFLFGKGIETPALEEEANYHEVMRGPSTHTLPNDLPF